MSIFSWEGLIALLLGACSRPGDKIDFVPVGGVNPDLQEIAIAEFDNSGIAYRVTKGGILEADFARSQDIVEIVTRVWETHLPRERTFNINPDYLAAFRVNLKEASIPYRSVYVDDLEWTVVDKEDAVGARQAFDRAFGSETDGEWDDETALEIIREQQRER